MPIKPKAPPVNVALPCSSGRVVLVAPHEAGRAQLTTCDEVPGPGGLPMARHTIALLDAGQLRALAHALVQAADALEDKPPPTSLEGALSEPKGAA